MPRLSLRPPRLILWGAIGAALVSVGASSAHASFPGSNGKIAITIQATYGCGDCDDYFSTVILGREGANWLGARSFAYSPSGTRMAYADNDYSGLWVARHDGSKRRLLARSSATAPAWSPAGGVIAYTSELRGGLVVASADGRSKRRLPVDGSWPEFAWSPSGGQLAVATDRSLTIVGIRGSYTRTLVEGASYDPGWSRTGWLSYVRPGDQTSPGPTLFVVRRSGGAPRALHAPERGYVTYAWSPDGRRIALMRSTGLWVIEMPSGTPRLLARQVTQDRFTGPEWSPDGRLIAYTEYQGPRHRVFTVRADGGQPRLFRTFNDGEGGDGFADDIEWQARPHR